MREYKLPSGIIGRHRRLVLATEYVEFENLESGGTLTRWNKNDIVDFRYGTGDIHWYKYVIGKEYSVTLKDAAGHQLKILLENFFNLHKGVKELYTDIVNEIWTLYHNDVCERLVERFHKKEEINIQGIKLLPKGVQLKDNTVLPWERVGVNEYNTYFTVYDDDNPVIHSRINFNEFGTETLWCTLRTLLKEQREKAAKELLNSK